MTTNANPHIMSIVEATQEFDRVLRLAADFEATQERKGRASQVETVRLDTAQRVATLLHNLTLETPDHNRFRIVR